ncbi:MAG: membrane protein insertase YidC [Chloroflexota bacterium]
MWQTFLNLMLNIMVGLYQFLGGNFILALVSFTVIMRILMLPVNLRQQRSSIKMQQIQPQVQAIQKKYKNDQQKMMEEFNKIGYNPADSLLGCLPLLIQMPIFFALYRVINIMLQGTPLALLDMKFRLWETYDLASLLPIDNTFLWVNLAQPDPYLVLPILVAGTMFLQQKLMMPASDAAKKDSKKKGAEQDNPAAQMQQSMLYTMPLMFGFFAMSFGSGLAIYFVVSNIIGIGQGYIVRRNLAEERAIADQKREESKKLAKQYEDEEEKETKNSQNGSSAPKASANGSQSNKSKKKKKKGKK